VGVANICLHSEELITINEISSFVALQYIYAHLRRFNLKMALKSQNIKLKAVNSYQYVNIRSGVCIWLACLHACSAICVGNNKI
jgi:hypothetical protein